MRKKENNMPDSIGVAYFQLEQQELIDKKKKVKASEDNKSNQASRLNGSVSQKTVPTSMTKPASSRDSFGAEVPSDIKIEMERIKREMEQIEKEMEEQIEKEMEEQIEKEMEQYKIIKEKYKIEKEKGETNNRYLA